jgi:hypothetical protein
MFPIDTKRFSAILIFSLLTASIAAADPRYVPPGKNAPPTKAEMERKSAEAKRKIEQAQRDIKAAQQKQSQQVMKNLADARSGTNSQSSAPKFDPVGAPPPDEVFQTFVNAAKAATSMEQLLPYLPDKRREALKSRQSMFDPKQAAENRASLYQRNPKLTEDDLAHLSSSPFASMLKWHKSMANSIVKIQGVKIDGDKATIAVVTNSGATINGEHFGYGTADVKMVGEGRTWKVAGFDSSIMVYREAP